MRWALILVCSVLVVLAGCGSAAPQFPAQGGPRWLELKSPHFTVWTDTSAERAHELVAEMEHLRQVIIGTAFRSVAGDGTIFVVMLGDLAEFHAFFPERFWGFAMPATGNPLRQPMIFLIADTQRGGEQQIEAHELTHAISYAMIPRQPRWFAEGLAKFFETLHIDDDAGTAELGRAPENRGQPIQLHHLIGLGTMFACKPLSCADDGFYATAWAVFTYLQNTHAAQLAHFEQLLAARRDWQEAWAESFPQLPVATLEAELRLWLTSGSHHVLHFNVQFRDSPIAQRELRDAEVHVVRALLGDDDQHADRAATASHELETARQLEPTNVLANLLSMVHQHPIESDAARAITAAHPEDWRAWWMLAVTLRSGTEAMAARDEACRRAAADPAVVTPEGLCEAARIAPPAADR